MNIRLLLTPLLAALATSASAVERYWDGGDATTNLTAANNWDGNTALNLATDDLNFNSGVPAAKRTAFNNYAPNTVFRTLNFLDSGYTIGGTIMAPTNGVTGFFATGGNTVNASFAINSSQTFAVNGGGDLTLGGQIFLNGTATLNLQPIHVDSVINVDGILSSPSTSGLRITGDGTVNINGSKDYNSNLLIENGGELNIDNNGGLGTTSGVTTLNKGTLIFDSAAPLTIPETLRLINTDPDICEIISRGGAHTLTGGIEVSGTIGIKRFVVEGPSLTVSGPITGNPDFGSIMKYGTGKMIINGTQSNTSTIQILNHRQGEMLLQKTGGALATSCPYVSIGSNFVLPDSVVLRNGASHQIIDTARVDLGSDGLWDLAGFQETVAGLYFRGAGHVTVGAGTLRITGDVEAASVAENGGNAVITGPVILESPNSEWEVYGGNLGIKLTSNGAVSSVAPGGILTKTGDGILEINGNHSIPLVNITDGSLILSGNSPATNVRMSVTAGQLEGLDATGTIGNLSLQEGRFQSRTWASFEEVTCGNLAMAEGVEHYVALRNTTPGDHDVVHVKGTVNINNASLWLQTLAPQPAIGAEVVIVDNDGSDPVTGTYANAPEGSIVLVQYVISYKGGDGNDITITRIVPPTGVTRTWDGGGNDDNWMTANNWNPNVTPQPGDDLVFPVAALRKTNNNNFPAGTTFNSITINGTMYYLGGNRVTLNSKLEYLPSPNSTHGLSLPLTLAQNVTLSVTGDPFIQSDSPIDTNGHQLIIHSTMAPAGAFYLSGNISGTGSVRKTGAGTFTFFDHDQSYTGHTWVDAGTLHFSYHSSPGAPGGGTTVAAGAALQFNNNEDPISCAENITLHGTIRTGSGEQNVNLTGAVNAASSTATIESDTTGMILSGVISGSVLHKAGTGSILIAGTAPNTLNGGMFVDNGQLVLDNSVPNAFACPVIIGNAALPAKVTYGGNNQIADNTTVQIVHPTGILEIGANTDTINALVMNGGTVTGTATGRLTLETLAVNANAATAVVAVPIVRAASGGILQVANGTASPDLRFDAALYGTAFEKQGAGRADFMTSIPTEGLDLLKVTAGHANFFANCRYTNIELNGGTVGGSGIVGNTTALPGGTVSPGTDTSPGGLGIYTSTWSASTTLRVEINGTNPGGEFDQIAAFAPLNLGSSALTLTVAQNYDPAPGTEFMIVRNVSGQLVANTFAGIPEGGFVSAPGAKVFRLSYTGGDGDDVVLTKVDAAPPEIVEHGMQPATGEEHKGDYETDLTVKGTPGLTYQLESSTDLINWSKEQITSADLQTGLMHFEFFNPETDPRLFLRVRLP